MYDLKELELIEQRIAPWGSIAENYRMLFLADVIQLSQSDPKSKGSKALVKELNRIRKALFKF